MLLPSTPRPSRTRPLDRERLRTTMPTLTSPPGIEPSITTPPASATRPPVLKRLTAIPSASETPLVALVRFSTPPAAATSHWVARPALISQRATTILILATKALLETPTPSASVRQDFRQKLLSPASVGQLW